MKAQSPKNVESGENLYRCDSSTGHRVAVWRLCVQVVVIVLVEDGAGAGASGALAGPRAPGGAGGKPGRGEGRPLLTPRPPGRAAQTALPPPAGGSLPPPPPLSLPEAGGGSLPPPPLSLPEAGGGSLPPPASGRPGVGGGGAGSPVVGGGLLCLPQELRREEVFVTSKLWNTKHHPEDVEAACRSSLAQLGLSYLDLYLVHWPMAFQRGEELMPRRADGTVCYSDTHYLETWRAMEALVDQGLVRAIGLSNFSARQMDDVIAAARHRPAVNQVECHPYLSQASLLSHCRSVGVCMTAYSPLGSGDRPWASADEPRLLDDPKLGAIAEKYQKTAAQVVLRWQVQRGVVCVPKSVTPSRILQNLQVCDFSLSEEDMRQVEALDLCRPSLKYKTCVKPLTSAVCLDWRTECKTMTSWPTCLQYFYRN
uniref:Aldo-keto reductase family 1, member A1a (aldehyde reductase) n=1 Tax=Gadus morhua TaxID=8049 RepID=A0A8C5A0J1_GADMO